MLNRMRIWQHCSLNIRVWAGFLALLGTDLEESGCLALVFLAAPEQYMLRACLTVQELGDLVLILIPQMCLVPNDSLEGIDESISRPRLHSLET